MIRTPADLLLISALLGSFALFVAGYTLVIHDARRAGYRWKEIVKATFTRRASEQEMSPRGARLIYLGAFIGAVIFLSSFFWIR